MAKRRRKKTPPAETAEGRDESKKQALDDFLGMGSLNEPQRKAPDFDPRWAGLVDVVLDIASPAALYRTLVDDLTIEDGALDYATVRQAVERAARNYYEAKRLERAAKLHEKEYTLSTEKRIEVLRSTALEELRKNRKAGEGAITKQMIRFKMLENWPAEFSTIEKRTAKLHAAVRTFEGLSEAWNHRNSQLKIMLERVSLGRTR